MAERDLEDVASDGANGSGSEVVARARYEAAWLSIARRWGVEIEDVSGLFHRAEETTLVFTTELILGDQDLRPGWHCVGPLMSSSPPSARPSRPLVYVCFGTVHNARPELFRAVLEGLAGEPIDLVVSTGEGGVSPSDLAPVPPSVQVHEFVPAREVLAAASVHVTHAGLASVHESLFAGVPMLCLPQELDQFPLAGRVAELGAGLLATADPGSVRDGVRTLLASPVATRRARELRDHLESYDGERRVAEVIGAALSI
jgi:MGT family glycosyltransferase